MAVILLINGAFGAGKTTLAEALAARDPNLQLFDPEDVGQILRRTWGAIQPMEDFQEYPAWVPGVVQTARTLRWLSGRDLVLPICVADASRYRRLVGGLLDVDRAFLSICLVASPELIRSRLRERGESAGGWADARVEACCRAHASGEFGVPLDASQPVPTLADRVLGIVHSVHR